MKIHTWRWAGMALLLLVPAARAQEKAEAPAPAEAHGRVPPTPLRVQVVFSKYQGERKVASLPYTLTCNAGERQPAVLRMGIEVPVPMSTAKEGLPAAFQYQYKNVGTNIDCRAGAPEEGRYRLELNIEQSSIYSPAEEKVTPAGKEKDKDGKVSWGVTDTPLGGAPLFRSFRASFAPFLRDGQTVQYTVATDPVSGEVVKIDVTVTVLK